MSDESSTRTDQDMLKMVGKIVVGAVFGIVMMGVVAPIVLAIIVGLADGH